MKLGSTLLNMVFSRMCDACGSPVDEVSPGSLCWACREKIHLVQLPFCNTCGDPVAGAVTGTFDCTWCHTHRPAFDWARSAVRYDSVVRTVLRNLKYHDGLWVVPELTNWLEALWHTCPPEIQEADWITAVPLYPSRERMRTYNQAAVLAAALAKRMKRPFRSRVLWRCRPTPTQTRLTAAQRLHNVKGVFFVPFHRRVAGAKVVVVDDVMTTGATVNECARTLKAAGAASVMVLTAARG